MEAASRRQVMGPVLLRYGFSPDKRGSAELRRGSSVPCSVGGMGVKMCETVKLFKSDTTRKTTWKNTMVFPECVARVKGSRFTLGVWGWRVCSPNVAFTTATVRDRSQPSATVCGRSRMAVPMASSTKVVTFGSFQCRVASFRVAGVALRDSPTRFITCWQSFCVAGAILLRQFQEDELHCSWQAWHFGDFHRHFAWQAQHFRRVMLRVLCESHCQGWQGANCVVGVAFCEMCWKLTEASHKTSIFR